MQTNSFMVTSGLVWRIGFKCQFENSRLTLDSEMQWNLLISAKLPVCKELKNVFTWTNSIPIEHSHTVNTFKHIKPIVTIKNSRYVGFLPNFHLLKLDFPNLSIGWFVSLWIWSLLIYNDFWPQKHIYLKKKLNKRCVSKTINSNKNNNNKSTGAKKKISFNSF